jgi:hypothetical protein
MGDDEKNQPRTSSLRHVDTYLVVNGAMRIDSILRLRVYCARKIGSPASGKTLSAINARNAPPTRAIIAP